MDKDRQKKLIIILGIVLFGLIASGAAVSYTSKPSFCTSCHEVAPSVAGWEQGTHANVDCLKCHAEPGVMGKVKIKLGGLHEVKVHLTENRTNWDIKGYVPNERCLTCHEAKMDSYDKFIKPIHDKAIKGEEGFNCGQCHRSTIHGEKEYKDERLEATKS